MAQDSFGWSKWLSPLSEAIAIATGVPVITGALAGIWAYLSGRGLTVAIIVLMVFMMTMWVCIGFLWLRDRAKTQIRSPLDCSWGLRVDAAFLNKDVTNPDLEWQVVVQLRNVLPWPIKIDTIVTYLEIEDIVPNTKIDFKVPAVLTGGATAHQNFPPYKRDVLPTKERFKGKMELVIRYGHPDFGYSRIMTRKFLFEQIIKPTMPSGMSGFLFPVSSSILLSIGSYEEDRDEPYFEDRKR